MEEFTFDLDDLNFNDLIDIVYFNEDIPEFEDYLDAIYEVGDGLVYAFMKLGTIVPDEEERLRLLSQIWEEVKSKISNSIHNTQGNSDAL